MSDARHGDWVQVYRVVLAAGERAPQVPVETLCVPLEMKTKGFLLDEKAVIGQQVTICTLAGRHLQGQLVAINPAYGVDYGLPQPELMTIAGEVRAMLRGEKDA
ncbi:2-amino-4-oxopentanoate thiolase subunit OrtA [Sporomusa sp.]|uniref:2-amino-4-oxopentanoate thiolase subunit OrtA n=1 Tax=Sporomusa sp. TaxID=2078658 RepID=UPI002B797034|nr:2-amino-4-oxopentanoate thiolase subunit OrtA [Sporomusa sp.]HWR42737.1 2-amino-4-oxopentanoate thiolase subunit OrtA [Sporomusa sp.]